MIGESRWPPAVAVLVFMALDVGMRIWLERDGVIHMPWLAPALLVGLLVSGSRSAPGVRRARLARQQRRARLALLAHRRWGSDRAPAPGQADRLRLHTAHQSRAGTGRAGGPCSWTYVHLGFTNATAFSPTDVMPLTHRAKYTMLLQSNVALARFGLVIARAVNAFQQRDAAHATSPG